MLAAILGEGAVVGVAEAGGIAHNGNGEGAEGGALGYAGDGDLGVGDAELALGASRTAVMTSARLRPEPAAAETRAASSRAPSSYGCPAASSLRFAGECRGVDCRRVLLIGALAVTRGKRRLDAARAAVADGGKDKAGVAGDVVVDDDVDGGAADGGGEAGGEEVLDPDAGVDELGLMAGADYGGGAERGGGDADVIARKRRLAARSSSSADCAETVEGRRRGRRRYSAGAAPRCRRRDGAAGLAPAMRRIPYSRGGRHTSSQSPQQRSAPASAASHARLRSRSRTSR